MTHYLAVGLDAERVPSVGLLDFAETVGLETCHPSALTVDDLITILEKDADPEKLDRKAIDQIVQNSAGWHDQFDFMDSWFENDALVEEVLDKNPRARMPGKIKAIVTSVLQPRRMAWAERFLWTALWMKQQQASPWQNFFIMGRELHRNRPLARIPTMQNIAKVTVEARVSPGF